MSWPVKPLGKVADLCLGKMLDQKKNKGDLFPYLANVNVRWGSFDLADLRQMRFETHEFDRYGVKYGDIIMCEGGEPGRCAIWKEQVQGMMIQKALHRIRPHGCLNHIFLYYQFYYRGKNGEFSKLFTGATIKHLPGQNLAKLEIAIPPLQLQQKIASTLSAYDDLIENNRRRIQLLEESARQLYKEWFVRLRFPGHEHVKVVDGVPQGWERKALNTICVEKRDTIAPQKVNATTPYIGLEHMPRRSISLCNWGSAIDIESTKLVFKMDDILFGKIRSYFHKVGIALVDGITSSDAVVLSPTEDKFRIYLLLHVSSDAFVATSAKTAKPGSKMPRADWKYLLTLPVLIPSDSILLLFNSLLCPIVAQLKSLSLTNHKLAQARDLLLPKLMNGEVAV